MKQIIVVVDKPEDHQGVITPEGKRVVCVGASAYKRHPRNLGAFERQLGAMAIVFVASPSLAKILAFAGASFLTGKLEGGQLIT